MNKIVSKRMLSENVAELIVEVPLIAKKRKAGHFVIVRIDEKGERKFKAHLSEKISVRDQLQLQGYKVIYNEFENI